MLNGFVKRKVIKQTVMTTVYGVTRYGGRLQIAKQLKDQPEFPHNLVDPAATYLAGKTFESLNEMFESSQAIQAWFTECANLISGQFLRNVEWVTPLGLHVMQPYTKKISAGMAVCNYKNNHCSLKLDLDQVISWSGARSAPTTILCVVFVVIRNSYFVYPWGQVNFMRSLKSCRKLAFSKIS
jgi:hypothetical protein